MTTPTARIVAPDTIVVEGGAKSAPLPPARDFSDGKPDPELAKQIAEGAVRYHLHTLETLDKESRAQLVDPIDIVPADPEAERRRLAHQTVMRTVGLAAVLATVGIRLDDDRPAAPTNSGTAIRALHAPHTDDEPKSTRVDLAEGARTFAREYTAAASALDAARQKRERKAAKRRAQMKP